MTASSVRHQSQEPVFSPPFVISTSATETFSNPLSCTSGDLEELTRPKSGNIFTALLASPPCKCCKVAALSVSWQDRTALTIIPCIFTLCSSKMMLICCQLALFFFLCLIRTKLHLTLLTVVAFIITSLNLKKFEFSASIFQFFLFFIFLISPLREDFLLNLIKILKIPLLKKKKKIQRFKA
jgi:hypothetical protein